MAEEEKEEDEEEDDEGEEEEEEEAEEEEEGGGGGGGGGAGGGRSPRCSHPEVVKPDTSKGQKSEEEKLTQPIAALRVFQCLPPFSRKSCCAPPSPLSPGCSELPSIPNSHLEGMDRVCRLLRRGLPVLSRPSQHPGLTSKLSHSISMMSPPPLSALTTVFSTFPPSYGFRAPGEAPHRHSWIQLETLVRRVPGTSPALHKVAQGWVRGYTVALGLHSFSLGLSSGRCSSTP